MKRLLSATLLISATLNIAAQNNETVNDTTKQDKKELFSCILERNPTFPGGTAELKNFLRKNLKYPDIAIEYGVEGRAIMTFVVDIDGKITDIKTTNNGVKLTKTNEAKLQTLTTGDREKLKKRFALAFAKEAARVIRLMPKWIPGERQNGNEWKKVRTKYTLPVTFVM